MSEPRYCPACGSSKLDLVSVGNDKESGYGVFCIDCEWSGDIMPDDGCEIGAPAYVYGKISKQYKCSGDAINTPEPTPTGLELM